MYNVYRFVIHRLGPDLCSTATYIAFEAFLVYISPLNLRVELLIDDVRDFIQVRVIPNIIVVKVDAYFLPRFELKRLTLAVFTNPLNEAVMLPRIVMNFIVKPLLIVLLKKHVYREEICNRNLLNILRLCRNKQDSVLVKNTLDLDEATFMSSKIYNFVENLVLLIS